MTTMRPAMLLRNILDGSTRRPIDGCGPSNFSRPLEKLVTTVCDLIPWCGVHSARRQEQAAGLAEAHSATRFALPAARSRVPFAGPLYALALLVAALMGSACSTVDAPPEEDEPDLTTLRGLADQRDFFVGAAVGTGLIAQNAAYAEVLAREFNMVTPENAMKMGALRPNQQSFDFADADAIVDFAERNEMAVRGHTLVWHTQVPSWVANGSWSREQLMGILEDHIKSVVGHYKGRIAAWDVVNEAVADNGTMRSTIWMDVIGPEYIAMAFQWAHEADPDASLFYNDYSAEGMGNKSNAVYELVSDLRDEGVPIHGVGLQMHLTHDTSLRASDVSANIARLGELGLEVHITEMDVRMPLPATDAKLAQQADVFQTMLEVCLEAWNCTSFVLWGFTDRYSWIPSFLEGYGAALIFDDDLEPKFAYDAMRNALEQAD